MNMTPGVKFTTLHFTEGPNKLESLSLVSLSSLVQCKTSLLGPFVSY